MSIFSRIKREITSLSDIHIEDPEFLNPSLQVDDEALYRFGDHPDKWNSYKPVQIIFRTVIEEGKAE